MTTLWESILVAVVVGVALVWAVRAIWRSFRGGNSCTGCGSEGGCGAGGPRDLVTDLAPLQKADSGAPKTETRKTSSPD